MSGTMSRATLFTLLLLSLWGAATGYRFDGEAISRGEGNEQGRGMFILGRSKKVVKSEGGAVRLVNGHRWKGDLNPMHIGFVHMEPNTIFIPQYVDSNVVFFVREGEARIAWINEKDKKVEMDLKAGDINSVPAGSTFYVVNTGNVKLRIICSIDSVESLGYRSFQSFFIGGGTSVLEGFGDRTLTAAFNVTAEELRPIMKKHIHGPIIYWRNVTDAPPQASSETEEDTLSWLWQKVMNFITAMDETETENETEAETDTIDSSKSYNLYNTKRSFENTYGWSVSVDEHDYSPLKHSSISVYLVNLTAGSMLAPHVNPRATEYGIVLRGSGTIQVVFPNGTAAMNAEVREGDVFWVPRYFPFCQTASVEGSMEIFGFTTSSRRNRPQFLAGRSSVLESLKGAEMAAGFGVSEEELRRLLKAQKEEIILPGWEVERGRKEEVEEPMFMMKRGVAFA